MDIGAVRAAYRRYAKVYDPVFGGVFYPGRKRTLERVNRTGGKRILELGVGTGLALPSYRRDQRVVGIDASADMLHLARQRMDRRDLPHVEGLVEMDARRLAFADDSFDAVVAMYVMSVVPEPRRVLAEISRVSRPGGEIYICNHFAAENDNGPRRRVEEAMAPLAERLGWHSDFPMKALFPAEAIEVCSSEQVPPLGLFTLVECRNAKPATQPATPPRRRQSASADQIAAHA